MSNKIKGKYGEDLAVNYLIKKGYKIIERNYRFSRYGEVDIIALDPAFGGTLSFIEVKSRSSNAFGTAFEAITPLKLDKIRKCALSYLPLAKCKFKNYRIDAISVSLHAGKDEKEPEIKHIKNIEF